MLGNLPRYMVFALCLVMTTTAVYSTFNLHAQQKPKQLVTLNLAEAQQDPDFLLQGEYAREGLGIQVVAKGKGKFLIVTYKGGLPGAGYDGKNKQILDDEDAEAVKAETSELKKIERESTTLNLKAPTAAIVLFDGTKPTFDKNWQPGARMNEAGLLQEGCTSIPKFQDYTLHAEFLLPFKPEAKDQSRGNSGFYHQSRYETQVLDSFGLEGRDDELGGIYSISAPSLNMAFPPLRWQTYDIDFKAARFDATGKKLTSARLTVKLNGVVVQNDVEVPNTTPAAPLGKESTEPGPLHIQNHGNPVLFRNIWVLPKDATREDARPKISSLERFQPGSKELSNETAGFVLLGELNCTSCHTVGKEWSDYINAKQAPILTQAGSRINHDYFSLYFANNHGLKPGTTMPELLHQIPAEQRAQTIAALSEFMKSTGIVDHSALDANAIKRGEKLYHEVGCAVCHGSNAGEIKTATLSTSVPLGKLELKYTISSLQEFLNNPHAVRASGRMPALLLGEKGATDIANYLLKDLNPKYQHSSAQYEVYEGSFKLLPDFSKLKPVKTGVGAPLDITLSGKDSDFAMRFTSEIKLRKDGNYKFTLGSDDGSRLIIDGVEVVSADGIHAYMTVDKDIKLKKGTHKIVVEYFEQVGQEQLTVDIEEKYLPKMNLASLMTLPDPTQDSVGDVENLDENLVAAGRTHFISLGCANCHELKQDDVALKSTRQAAGLLDIASKLPAELKGCLATSPVANAPWYSLSDQQIANIKVALTTIANTAKKADKPEPRDTAELLHQQLVTNNCYACHVRGGIGGPETARNAYFVCTIPEMGDEGRLPPILDGVGDKLQDGYLNEVWDKGVDQRPYMLTAMPKFGSNVKVISDYVVKLDRKTEAPAVTFEEPEFRTKTDGRLLTGEKGLACVKCHTFDKYPATGIQAVALDKMTSRLREDWFRRYLFEPTKYRPGTRMPTGYPEGKATIKDVCEGNPDRQIASIWTYLKDGNKAAVPAGLIPDPIELVAVDKPVIYRNFIKDVSPRGIAVGYPQKMNLTFDADKNALRLLWSGSFIDASLHWRGRGVGSQSPMGDNLIVLEQSTPFVNDNQEPLSFKFKGYQLNDQGEPTFNYGNEQLKISDLPQPIKLEKRVDLKRTLTIQAENTSSAVNFVAAMGKKIEAQPDGSFLVDGYLNMTISGDVGSYKLMNKNDKQWLVYPIKSQAKSTITQNIKW